jgi:dipeptidase E
VKLLLTSGGLKNQSLINVLSEMTGLAVPDMKIASIPTASGLDLASKAYALQQKLALKRLGFAQVCSVDIAKLPQSKWQPLLEEAHIIYVNGGNTTYLMKCIAKSGLQDVLPELLERRVYVGVSAGSYVTTPDTRLNSDNVPEVLPALHYVDFGIQAHYKSTSFKPASTLELVKERTKDCTYPVYVLDDQSAVKVVNDTIEVVSEGEWLLLKPKAARNRS